MGRPAQVEGWFGCEFGGKPGPVCGNAELLCLPLGNQPLDAPTETVRIGGAVVGGKRGAEDSTGLVRLVCGYQNVIRIDRTVKHVHLVEIGQGVCHHRKDMRRPARFEARSAKGRARHMFGDGERRIVDPLDQAHDPRVIGRPQPPSLALAGVTDRRVESLDYHRLTMLGQSHGHRLLALLLLKSGASWLVH